MTKARLLTGRLGGQFNIIDQTTRIGGTAEVFKAIDINSGQAVAVKILNQGKASELAEEAMRRELSSLQELNGHPNIGKICDFGEEEQTGSSFIVLEWLERSLLEIIEENPRGLEQLLSLLWRAAFRCP